MRFADLKHTRDMQEADSIIGQQFSFWQVISEAPRRKLPSGKNVRMMLCRCKCGVEKEVFRTVITSGGSKSCGCKRGELFIKSRTRHGHARKGAPTPEYKAWEAMISRCENPTSCSYKWYGARGIKVCSQWRESFSAFLKDMGLRPSSEYSIDRFPDSNGNYEPGNCRWATVNEQNGNRRISVLITAYGVSRWAAEWSRITGIAAETIIRRIRVRGMSAEDALSKPVADRYKRKENADQNLT